MAACSSSPSSALFLKSSPLPSGWHRQQLPCADTHTHLWPHEHTCTCIHTHTHRCSKHQHSPSAHPAMSLFHLPHGSPTHLLLQCGVCQCTHTHHASPVWGRHRCCPQQPALGTWAVTRGPASAARTELLTRLIHPCPPEGGLGAHTTPTLLSGG